MREPIDWLIVVAYVVIALAIGVYFSRRASKNVDEFFLSGRTLPWWIAGTSMVATTFAADTPLVVTGWVRDHGIWKNWLWWCLAISGMFTVFLFSRYWRRGGVMTKAEIAELRYGGKGARALRGTLGVIHSTFSNTITICWVLVAAKKIIGVLLDVDEKWAVVAACVIALSYSLLAGFWGVVLTDMLQFAMAMTGAIVLAVIAWNEIGGSAGLLEAAASSEAFHADTLSFFPESGGGGPFDASFWTVALAGTMVYLGVQWWAFEGVDGSSTMVQRIAASRDDRHGMLASLWYCVAHYAFRPWPWILVALASLVILPNFEVTAPTTGTVAEVAGDAIVIAPEGGGATVRVPLEESVEGWAAVADVAAGDRVVADEVIAATDSESAYVQMMVRYLPLGILGLVAASLLAAFMSTIDTHVNLAASFFVNDVYRRFLVPEAEATHYVWVARAASVGVMAIGGFFAYLADSISDLFTFFLAFLGGVGPIYVLRWLWWRVRVSTELTAMISSAVATCVISFAMPGFEWKLGPLSPDGALSDQGRICLVILFSLACSLSSLALTKAPDPAGLVDFYRRVRPMGWWGPVRRLAPDVGRNREAVPALVGVAAGLSAVYGALFGTGLWLLDRPGGAAVAAAFVLVGIVGVSWSLGRLKATTP